MNFDIQRRLIVELDDPHLPIACPNERTPVELLHPRVWLAPTHENMVMCPYCGTVYHINWGEKVKKTL